MKNSTSILFISITLAFVAFVGGFWLGRNTDKQDITLSAATVAPSASSPTSDICASTGNDVFPININTATQEQLDMIPEIGPATAQRIIDYRNTIGRFQSTSDLLFVQGIGEKTLAKIIDYITI